MNKRIRELVDQCWEEDGIGPVDFNPEKFARLIIRESISCLNDCAKHIGDVRTTVGAVEKTLKQHFGVE